MHHVFKLLSPSLRRICSQPWPRSGGCAFPRPADGRAGHDAETQRDWTKTRWLSHCCRWLPPARADLSHFNVGAIARGVSGTWYFGGNMEFLGATMQQTVHAEQSAISHAWLRGEKGLAAITVNYTPCGHCRQFMNELNSGLDLRIHLPGRAPHVLRDYLPDAFGPKDLEIKTLLMDDQDHGFALQGDALTQAAITAANRCHMPYSKSPSGVALECKDGRIFSGSYAENAALTQRCRHCRAR
jgi:cytidine deaminase